jgi:predicted GNAT family N-acyltransferase
VDTLVGEGRTSPINISHNDFGEPSSHRQPCVQVRPTRAADRAAVLEVHARCSRETRYSRWLGPSSHFPLTYLHSLLADVPEHLAVVAVADGQPECVIGLASAAMTSDRWELGILVEDRRQAQGTGRLMLDSLMELLDPNEPLYATSLSANRWLLRKLARFGSVRISHDSGVSHAYVDRKAVRDGV